MSRGGLRRALKALVKGSGRGGMMNTATLVAMRLDRMWVKHPATDETRFCGQCGKPVGIYPSGQAFLSDYPDARIICDVCAGPEARFGAPVPGAIEEAIDARKRRG